MSRRTIILTRPVGKYSRAVELISMLTQSGFSVRPIAVLEYVSVAAVDVRGEVTEFDSGKYDWMVFSSPIAVSVFRDLVQECTGKSELPKSLKIAVQGPGTAEALNEFFGRSAEMSPRKFVAESLSEELKQVCTPASRVLHPGAREGRDVVERELREAGIQIKKLVTYTTRHRKLTEEDEAWIKGQEMSELVFVFMSPSAVAATVAAFAHFETSPLKKAAMISVGPITSREILKHGLRLTAEAREHSAKGIVEVVGAVYRPK